MEVLLPAPTLDEDMDVSFPDAMKVMKIAVPTAEIEMLSPPTGYNFDNLDYEG